MNRAERAATAGGRPSHCISFLARRKQTALGAQTCAVWQPFLFRGNRPGIDSHAYHVTALRHET